MINLFLWVVISFFYYCFVFKSMDFLLVSIFMSLSSILPLMFFKWWCYLEGRKFFHSYFFNYFLSSLSAITMPLIIVYGFEYVDYNIVIFSIFAGFSFFPDGCLKWFWSIRFGDLREFPDVDISSRQLNRIRGLAFASIFGAPIVHGALFILWK